MRQVHSDELKRDIWQINLLDGLICLQFNEKEKKSGWVQTPTQPAEGQIRDERVYAAAFMALVHATTGVDIESVEYINGLQLFIEAETE